MILVLLLTYLSASLSFGAPVPVQRIGIYSGTFDPPHVSHRKLVEELKTRFHLDLIYVLPSVQAHHKPHATAYIHRKAMAELAFASDRVVIADAELERADREGGTHAAIRKIMERHGENTEFFRVMGMDTFDLYTTQIEPLTDPHLTWVVATRENLVSSEHPLPSHIGTSPVVHIPEVGESSSSAIRHQLRNGVVPLTLDPAVLEYIGAHHLYGLAPTEEPYPRCSAIWLRQKWLPAQ